MGEANENRNRSREMLNLSLEIDKYPRDLLQRFMSSSSSSSSSDSQLPQEQTPSEENKAEEIELSLGLSLGGRFGVDKNGKKMLLRSSSIAGSIPIHRESDFATRPATTSAIVRASSLPTETEEDWRKRKALQSLRRMEAKRRRIEKQRKSSSRANNSTKMDMAVNLKDEKQNLAGERAAVGPPFGMQSWDAAASKVLLGVGGGFLHGLMQLCSQGSVESQSGSSAGMSEIENKPLPGASSGGEARSPVTAQASQDGSNQDALGSSCTNVNANGCRTSRPKMESLSKKLNCRDSNGREVTMNAYEDMPCVFTKGDGPNGRKVEGILYRHRKFEEVRIMCVCHGSFLSPAEFVKHAGGGDVEHPLRRIVVVPSAAPFL